MRRWLRSLQVQLFLWAIMPVTFVIIALSFTGVYAHQQGMRDFVVDRDLAMVRLLAQIAQDGIAHGIVGSNGDELARWMGLDTRDLRGTAAAHLSPPNGAPLPAPLVLHSSQQIRKCFERLRPILGRRSSVSV